MVNMVSFMLCILYHDKKKDQNEVDVYVLL